LAVKCASCGTENRPGRKFCADCGAPLAVICPTCAALNEPGERFCGECGGALEDAAAALPPPPAAERRLVSVLFADLVGFTPLSESRDAEQADLIATFGAAEAALLRAQGRPAEASASATRGLTVREEVGISNAWVKRCLIEAIEASLAGDDLERADELLASAEALRPGDVSPHLDGHRARLRAQVEARKGGERVDELFRHAERVFGESAVPFHLAVAQLEHAEWLLAQPHAADAHILLAEARATFQRLEAAPWLARVEAAAEAQASTV
jgi:uncharacterized OB-fold protein